MRLTPINLMMLCCTAVALAACEADPDPLALTGPAMGTTYNITIVDEGAASQQDTVQALIDAALQDINAKLSNWDPNSEVSRFNAQQTIEHVQISDDFAQVMDAAFVVHDASFGRFDVTLGPLIDLWGFGSSKQVERQAPSQADIAATLQEVGQSNVLEFDRDGRSLRKTNAEATIYLAAIAKGYGIDRIANELSAMGFESFMVEIGGDLSARGLNPDGLAWRIGVETPDATTRKVEQVIPVADLGMATSGDYRNYFEENGVRYSHIIDGETGRPITHTTASVTVLAENAMYADAWATALLALGQERGRDVAEDLNLAVLFIERDTASREDGSEELRFNTVLSSRFVELTQQ